MWWASGDILLSDCQPSRVADGVTVIQCTRLLIQPSAVVLPACSLLPCPSLPARPCLLPGQQRCCPLQPTLQLLVVQVSLFGEREKERCRHLLRDACTADAGGQLHGTDGRGHSTR